MTKEITMPRLSETMIDGKILSWHKKLNDKVNKGDVVAEVETDKANMEVEAVDSGVLTDILIPEGQKAKVGEPIAILNGKVQQNHIAPMKPQPVIKQEQEPSEAPKPAKEVKEEKQAKPNKSDETKKTETDSQAKSSPMAKKLAEKHKINLAEVKGTGPGGRIREKDILDFLENEKTQAPGEAANNVKSQQLSRMRQTIADRMAYSKQNIPHFYVTYEVDADGLVEFYEKTSQKIPGITFNDIFIKATSVILRHHPEFNASFKGDSIAVNEKINIGVAFAVEEGLLVPVVHDADIKTIKEITDTMRTIKDKVKNNRLSQEDMTGGTFSLSNMGMFGVKEFSAIINPPEAAGLAIGAIMRAPVVRDDRIVIGNVLNLTLSADHRVVDGAKAALFLSDLKELLENPENIE